MPDILATLAGQHNTYGYARASLADLVARPVLATERVIVEHLWSRAGATSGNWWQMGTARRRLKQAKTVAMGCDRLPIGAHGKEGVDGSSPSEGLQKAPANEQVLLGGVAQW